MTRDLTIRVRETLSFCAAGAPHGQIAESLEWLQTTLGCRVSVRRLDVSYLLAGYEGHPIPRHHSRTAAAWFKLGQEIREEHDALAAGAAA